MHSCHIFEDSGKILSAGGIVPRYQQTRTVEIYDIDSGVSTQLPDLPTVALSFFSMEGRMLATKSPGTDLYAFQPETGAWEAEPHGPMTIPSLSGDPIVAIHSHKLPVQCSLT